MVGHLIVTYEVRIPNLEMVDAGPFSTQVAGARPVLMSLQPTAIGLLLTIEIETDDPSASLAVADGYATALGQHLTLCFCDQVKDSVVPKRSAQTFKTSDANVLHAFPGEVALTGQAVTARITIRWSGNSVQDALTDFSLRQSAPPPPWAADLVIARQMFFAALNVDNSVSRFLIIYGALAVFAAFKVSAKGGTQAKVDQIIKAEDPTVPMRRGRTAHETEFTGARNDFLHMEDRNRNPERAISKIEVLTPKLQALAGRILRKG